MTSRKILSVLTIGGVLCVNLMILASSDLVPQQAAETITADELRSIVYFLASDAMQGRDTGSFTNEITTNYLAHRLEELNLLPAGDRESYFQEFTLIQSGLGEGNSLTLNSDTDSPVKPDLGKDFFPARLSSSGTATGQLVFVGYGITAPELNYDDYAEVNAKGKVAVVLTGEPGMNDPESPFDGILFTDYSRELEKILNAQRHGASGVLLVPTDSNIERRFSQTWPENITQSAYTLEVWLNQVGIPAGYVSPKLLEDSLPPEVESFSDLRDQIDSSYKPVVFESAVWASLETDFKRERTLSRNVLAYLPGSDPALREEIVIIGAHLDHVGRDDETSIYNGADDNASGTAGVLEIAEAFTLNVNRPQRTILFAFWNAEEQGLLGSRFYVESPVFSLDRTVAVFQLDMIGRNQEVPNPENARFKGLEKQTAAENNETLNVLGYSRSQDMRELAERSNLQVGLRMKFELDETPLHLLMRSDHWPFLARGIPVLFFTTGLHPQYHTPQDTADLLNYPKMERVARLTFFAVWELANSTSRPRLNATRVVQ
ncbi:MAG TPA: M20/M25/M40 family metallo-hydrolase [Acidobacteriota bacterium]|nr:M20/M25/M40 family metallo-hydrolase [Acidobacteriota bacterium]